MLLVNTTSGQNSIFLKLDGIEGESTRKGYEKWIEVIGMDQSTTQSGSFAGGGGAGKVKFGEFKIVKLSDKSSPILLLVTAQGKHLRQAVLVFIGSDGVSNYTITLSDVLITGVATSSECNPNCKTTEQVSINYSKIEWSYKDRNGGVAKGGWDLKQNTSIN
jgi:type VI secretion system secreted protein Hcp